jgi:hypothetical protein
VALKQLRRNLPPMGAFGNASAQAAVPRCALVSSSKALLQHTLGGEIDSHDVVVRLNNAVTAG